MANRRAALKWLRENVQEGVMYFGDDDNTVDLQLFDEIRQTKKVSMFPVGLIGGFGVSTPIVKDGKVSQCVLNMYHFDLSRCIQYVINAWSMFTIFFKHTNV